MNEIKLLLKFDFKSFMTSAFCKKKKLGSFAIWGFCILITLLMMTSFFFMYFEIARSLSKADLTHYIFIQSGIVASVSVILLVALQTSVGFFRAKDKDLLASFPIKSSSIIVARLIKVILSSYYYSIITFLPSILIYFIFASFDVAIFFMLLGALIFIPMLPCAIGIMLGALVSFVSTRIKSKVFIIVISIFISVAVALFSSFYQDIIAFYIQNGSTMKSAMEFALPNVGFLIAAIEGESWKYAIFILISIVMQAISIGVSVVINKKVDFSKIAGQKKTKIYYKQRSIFCSMLRKEVKLYFTNVTYAVNTMMFFVLMNIFPFIYKFSGLSDVIDKNLLFAVIVISQCVMISMSYISSVSISAEGKSFAVLKTFPTSANSILIAKVVLHTLIGLGFSIVCSTIFVAFFPMLTGLEVVAIYFLPILACLASSLFGVLTNLWFPKLKYSHDAQFVKQSFSSFLGMLGGAIIAAVSFLLNIFVKTISQNYLILIDFCWFFVIIFVFFMFLFKKSEKLMSAIEV